MSTQVDAASISGDPALLRIDGAIATITLNRPNAFNSIDLSIAKKLEPADIAALSSYIEGLHSAGAQPAATP